MKKKRRAPKVSRKLVRRKNARRRRPTSKQLRARALFAKRFGKRKRNAKPGFAHLEPRSRGWGAKLPSEKKRMRKLRQARKKNTYAVGTRVQLSRVRTASGARVPGVWEVIGRRDGNLVVRHASGAKILVSPNLVTRANPSTPIERAAEKYKAFHWGTPHASTRRIKLSGMSGPFYALGQGLTLDYRAVKDGEKADYTHDFGEHSGLLPQVFANLKGDTLVIKGGRMRVRPEGIVE